MGLDAHRTRKYTDLLILQHIHLTCEYFTGYVMKYFMQYRSEVGRSLEKDQAGRMALLHSNQDIKELRYMLSMVDLLSTCAEVRIESSDV